MENSNQVVAVTGASGYLGSRLLLHLEDQDLEKLVGFDLNPPPNPIHNIVRYRMNVKDSIETILRNHRVTTVIHLASSPYHKYNRRDSRDARDRNLDLLSKGPVIDFRRIPVWLRTIFGGSKIGHFSRGSS